MVAPHTLSLTFPPPLRFDSAPPPWSGSQLASSKARGAGQQQSTDNAESGASIIRSERISLGCNAGRKYSDDNCSHGYRASARRAASCRDPSPLNPNPPPTPHARRRGPPSRRGGAASTGRVDGRGSSTRSTPTSAASSSATTTSCRPRTRPPPGPPRAWWLRTRSPARTSPSPCPASARRPPRAPPPLPPQPTPAPPGSTPRATTLPADSATPEDALRHHLLPGVDLEACVLGSGDAVGASVRVPGDLAERDLGAARSGCCSIREGTSS
jgi:hypothetical protein